jgi:hypothetical protein
MIGRPPADPLIRFRAKLDTSDPAACWIWTGTLINGLYGQFWDGKKKIYAHRWSYQHHVGPIPAGLQLDHLCRTPACVNPRHLEPVTARVNTLRSTSIPAKNAVKTHCKHGHLLTGRNLVLVPEGRKCRTCRTDINRRAKARKRAAA